MHIAVGGFQHETNTFAPTRARFEDFAQPDAWPGLTRGPALVDAVRGINLPLSGFIAEARSAGHRIAPLTWCSATPSGRVTEDAFERIAGMLLEDLRTHSGVDAVYLDLHGAMAAEHLNDADGELLRRVRTAIGRSMPLVASLDFHANVSELMLSQADALIAYRTYPHIDMAATGERALRALHVIRERVLHGTIAKLSFLIPLTSQCTLVEPLSSVMRQFEAAQGPGGVHIANFTPGFPPADVEKCGPAVVVHAETPNAAAATARELADLVATREHEFALETFPIEAALAKIDQLASGPIILADTQDNPGGGGTSDTTSLLRALSQTSHRALCGLMCDPVAARRAHDVGVGADIHVELGGHSGPAGETPLAGRYRVLALGDGNFTATGAFYAGARMALGPMALLRLGNLYIAVSSRKQQAADQAMFRHLGIEPERFPLLVLKSSVHFRADFASIAKHIIIVTAPGMNIADPAELKYTHLPATMRLAGAARPIRSPE